jgi:hypothetical protein
MRQQSLQRSRGGIMRRAPSERVVRRDVDNDPQRAFDAVPEGRQRSGGSVAAMIIFIFLF